MSKRQPIIREYKNSDKEAVLGLLRSNTPVYFSAEEESDLVHYLENEIEHYFVLEINGQVIGSGGFNFSGDKTRGKISWDMLHPDFHGKSFGSMLLNYRIEKLQEFKEVQKIIVRTSQLAYLFYEKRGFRLLETVEDHWAKGFHLYLMEYGK
jgi:N-acetylglutamate synthase-like GNAT family acetyltransferase